MKNEDWIERNDMNGGEDATRNRLLGVLKKWGEQEPTIKAVLDALAEVDADNVPHLTKALASIGDPEVLGYIQVIHIGLAAAERGEPIALLFRKGGMALTHFPQGDDIEGAPEEAREVIERGVAAIKTLNEIFEQTHP
jgi:catalase (peroxidase I)